MIYPLAPVFETETGIVSCEEKPVWYNETIKTVHSGENGRDEGEGMRRNILCGIALAGAVLVMAGCGGARLDDDFVFGKNRISCANETITVAVPFEMGISGQMADLAPKDAEKVNAEGHNRYMQILVSGEKAGTETMHSLADKAESLMTGSGNVSDLKKTRETVSLDGEEAIRLTFQFTDTEKGRSAALTVKEYIFQQGNTLWRVIYQYRSGDSLGKALTERVEGHIVRKATF